MRKCERCGEPHYKFNWNGVCQSCINMEQYQEGNPNYFLCPICGEPDTPDDYMPFTWENMNYCFSCEFWKEKEQLYNEGNLIVINGRGYVVDNEDSRRSFRGSAGRKFTIYRYDTGETITTTNLWTNGDVPERFRNVLQDNAKFLEKG